MDDSHHKRNGIRAVGRLGTKHHNAGSPESLVNEKQASKGPYLTALSPQKPRKEPYRGGKS